MKKGFTLVEILVVIAIAAVLGSLAVNGYSQYRRTALLDFSADAIVAQIYEMQARTGHGDVDGVRIEAIRAELNGETIDSGSSSPEGEAKCYGFYFEDSGSGTFILKSFSQPFDGRKTWGGDEGWKYVGCTGDMVLTNFDLDKNVRIYGVKNDEADVSGNFYVRFYPPSAGVESDLAGLDVLEIGVQYGEGESFRRTVQFDLKTKNAEKVN